MPEKPKNFEIDRNSTSSEVAEFINRAFETADLEQICRAIGAATKIHDIKAIAAKAGIARTSVYRAFSGPKYPNFSTVHDVVEAMGLKLQVKVRSPKVKRTRLTRAPNAES